MEQDEDTRDVIEGIRLENEGGRLLLNGTDISSSDDGDRVSLEPLLQSDRSTFWRCRPRQRKRSRKHRNTFRELWTNTS